MTARAGSDIHIRHVEDELFKGESISHHYMLKITKEVKTEMLSSHFFLCSFPMQTHISNTTNIDRLIKLVISCGRKDLEVFVRRAAKNASCTSSDAITDFMKAIGVRFDELHVNQLPDAPFFSPMADKCTNITTVEELSIFSNLLENHFMGILNLKRGSAESI